MNGATAAVFVDATGRRRRLVTVMGTGLAAAAAAAIGLLVSGVVGASPASLPGLPAGDGALAPAGTARPPTRAAPDPRALPVGTTSASTRLSAGPSASTVPSPTPDPGASPTPVTHGHRPSAPPGQSKRK